MTDPEAQQAKLRRYQKGRKIWWAVVVALVLVVGIAFLRESSGQAFWAGLILGFVLGLLFGLPFWFRTFGRWWRGEP